MNDRKPPPESDPDFDDAAPLTDEEIKRLRPASEVHGKEIAEGLVRPRGRPKLAKGERKQQVTLRLSPDVLEAYRATGDGWQTRIDDTLRAAMKGNAVGRSTRSGQIASQPPAHSGGLSSRSAKAAAKDRKAG